MCYRLPGRPTKQPPPRVTPNHGNVDGFPEYYLLYMTCLQYAFFLAFLPLHTLIMNEPKAVPMCSKVVCPWWSPEAAGSDHRVLRGHGFERCAGGACADSSGGFDRCRLKWGREMRNSSSDNCSIGTKVKGLNSPGGAQSPSRPGFGGLGRLGIHKKWNIDFTSCTLIPCLKDQNCLVLCHGAFASAGDFRAR